MRALLVCLLALIPCGAHAADPLALQVRTALPASVATVGDAIRYYIEPTGLRFEARTPGGADVRLYAASTPARVPTADQILSVADAVLYQLGDAYDIAVDPAAGVLTLVDREAP